MTHEEKETPGAATPGVTVNIDGELTFSKEQVLHLVETLKADNSLLQKHHLQYNRRNGFLRKLRAFRDCFINRDFTLWKLVNKHRELGY